MQLVYFCVPTGRNDSFSVRVRYGEGGVEKYRTRRVFLGYSYIVNGAPLGTDLVPSLDLRLLHVCIVCFSVCVALLLILPKGCICYETLTAVL